MKQRQKFRQRCQRIWSSVKAWLVNYGFAGLVFLAFVGGAIASQRTEVPPVGELPGLAFGSQTLYRNEVGGISFIFYYLAALVFVLALNGRGFTQFGLKGVRDGKVVNRETHETIKGQEQSIIALERDLAGNIEVSRMLKKQAAEQQETMAEQQKEIAELRQRLDKLEGSNDQT
jgi:hypothetical protein